MTIPTLKLPEMPKAPVVPEVPTIAAETPMEAPVEAPIEQEEPVIEAVLTLAQPMPTARPRAFYLASYWHIEAPMGSDMIEAINNQTGDRYSGPVSDFNDMLRGD